MPDENFAVFRFRCQNTKGDYLVKYARHRQSLGIECERGFALTSYKLVGAFTVDRETYEALSIDGGPGLKMNTSDLEGAPNCPCCGNAYSVVCQCGHVFCSGNQAEVVCPWCGMHGTVGNGGGDGRGIDVNRGLG